MYAHILAATDGSERANNAITTAAQLAKTLGSKLTIFYCAPVFHTPLYADGVIPDAPEESQFNARVKTASEKLLVKAAELAAQHGVTAQTLFAQDDVPHAAIIATCNTQGCDLVVLATHGRGALSALLLGSTTHKLLSHTKIATLVVH